MALFRSLVSKITIIYVFITISFFSCKKKNIEPAQMLPTSIEFVDKNGISKQDYRYNEAGYLIEIKYYTNDIASRKIVFEYHPNNQLRKLSYFTGGSPVPRDYQLFEYSLAGRLSGTTSTDGIFLRTYNYEYASTSKEALLTKHGLFDGSSYQRFEYDKDGNLVKIFYKDSSQPQEIQRMEVLKYDGSKRGIFSAFDKNFQKAYIIVNGGYIFNSHILHCPINYRYLSHNNNISTFSADNMFNHEGYPTKITYTPAVDGYWDDPNIIINITYKKK